MPRDLLGGMEWAGKSSDLSEWRNWAAVGFISRTGVRLSSAVNLKWTDIDFEKHICLPRHTFATLYLQKGGRAEKLQKILGHKTADMTQRYVHYVTHDLVEDIDDFTF